MPSRELTVESYLAALPADRRAALEALRKVIRKNLDPGFEEGIQYGMIGYFVPHRVFPAGYHCDPKQPLPFAGIASRKGYMTLAVMGLYLGATPEGEEPGHREWFEAAWKRSGKKLDIGAACIRFKSLDDVPLDVVGQTFKRFTAASYVALYERIRASHKPTPRAEIQKRTAPKKTAKKTARKTAKRAAK